MPNNDVIGAALLDFYQEKEHSNIVVKSSISEEDVISVPYLYRTYIQMPLIEQQAIDKCQGFVLDVGAGSGCHSLELQNKGLEVEAIDVSEGAVKVMQQRGVNAKRQNFYSVEGGYDTLLFLMNGVGIAGTLKELPHFLEKAKSMLNPGGQILLDSSDIKYMYTEEDGSVWVDLNSAYYGEVNYSMQYKNLVSAPFDWLFVDYNTLKSVAKDCGFNIELVSEGEHFDYLARLTLTKYG